MALCPCPQPACSDGGAPAHVDEVPRSRAVQAALKSVEGFAMSRNFLSPQFCTDSLSIVMFRSVRCLIVWLGVVNVQGKGARPSPSEPP